MMTELYFFSAGGVNVSTPYEAASSSTTTGVHEAATPGVNQQTSEFCGLYCNQVTLRIVYSPLQNSREFSSVQFILFAFINYSTKLHIIIIHMAGSPGSYFAYLKDCLKKRSKKTRL